MSLMILDILIRTGDICDQSRKLLQIALNFGRFFTLPNFVGSTPCKISVRVINPLRTTSPGNIS